MTLDVCTFVCTLSFPQCSLLRISLLILKQSAGFGICSVVNLGGLVFGE